MDETSRMHQNPDQEVQNELQSGEAVKWSGRPSPLAHLTGSFAIFLLAIPWTAFSLFWIAAASGFKVPDFNKAFDFFPLFGLPFLFVGLGMLLMPLFIYVKAQKIIYIITNQRAFEMYCGRWGKVKNYSPGDIGNIERREKPDGRRHLYFRSRFRQTSQGQRQFRVGFKGIENVKAAETCIHNLKSSHKR